MFTTHEKKVRKILPRRGARSDGDLPSDQTEKFIQADLLVLVVERWDESSISVDGRMNSGDLSK